MTAARLVELPSCDSTNSWALAHLDELPHGSCVWTTCQTAGRGQAGRHWLSDPGVLTASWVLHLQEAASAGRLSLAAGLALIHAIEDCCPDLRPPDPAPCPATTPAEHARSAAAATEERGGMRRSREGARPPLMIKWPNDVYLEGRKLAGILCEARLHGAGLRAVVGIGCNVEPAWGEQPPIGAYTGPAAPIALNSRCQPPAQARLRQALGGYLVQATGLLADGRFDRLLPAMRARNWLAGRRLCVNRGDGPLEAVVADYDEQGRLLLIPDAGAAFTIDSPRHLMSMIPHQTGGPATVSNASIPTP